VKHVIQNGQSLLGGYLVLASCIELAVHGFFPSQRLAVNVEDAIVRAVLARKGVAMRSCVCTTTHGLN
jgi:hypothetical protein